MNFVIIGANGFFGSKLCDFLYSLGHNVKAVYNKNSSNINSKIEKIHKQELSRIESDNTDIVIYSVGSYLSSYDEFINANSLYLKEVSDYFKDSKLIFISSINVYGSHVEPINEKSCFNNPGIYGLSKLAGEFIVKNHKYYAIVRFTYLYGSGLEGTSFLPLIIANAKNNSQIVLFGQGEREQDYLHVNDAVDFCLKVAFSSNQNDIYIGASGISYSNRYIAELIVKRCEETRITYSGEELAESIYINPTVSFNKLNWSPSISIEEGIGLMVNG